MKNGTEIHFLLAGNDIPMRMKHKPHMIHHLNNNIFSDKKEDSCSPFLENGCLPLRMVCVSPETRGRYSRIGLLDPKRCPYRTVLFRIPYGRKTFGVLKKNLSQKSNYSFAPMSACISISTSCVGRFNSLIPIQVQQGLLSLKNSEYAFVISIL